MLESQAVAAGKPERTLLVLGVDTCGPSGSVALARLVNGSLELLGQKELAGRTYSATLVSTIGELLVEAGATLRQVDAIVVVKGPGSFTGVRVGLSAVKGLAEPGQIPVVAVSRLAVMAAKAGVESAALDAHRHEVFLRIAGPGGSGRELLAGAEELAGMPVPAEAVAVCEENAGLLLKNAWLKARLVRTLPPTAGDAIELCVPRMLAGEFADLASLDGHYLRRSDAEIFGEKPRKPAGPGSAGSSLAVPGVSIRVGRMRAEHLDAVIKLASATDHAPDWTRQVYEKAMDSESQPRRVAMIAENTQSGALVGFAVASLVSSQAELETIVTAVAHQRRGVAKCLFSSLKSELRQMGAREVILEVRAGNHAAQSLYRQLGFVVEGRRTAYYADPVEDAVLMRLVIAGDSEPE